MVDRNSKDINCGRTTGNGGRDSGRSRRNGGSLQVGGMHYDMQISPVEYIEMNSLGFMEGNVVKYVSRHEAKGGEEDILKAISYCKLILRYRYGWSDEELTNGTRATD